MNENETVKKITVILKSLLTYLVIAQTALTAILASGALDAFPAVVSVALIILSGIGVVITFVRRVQPVPKEFHSLT